MDNKKITAQQLAEMNHLYRINLVNSLTGYKSANLIGSIDKKGQHNVAVFSSVTHFGSNPPLIGVVMRPTTVVRNTYDNIKATGYYTINHINSAIIEKAHQTSAKYPSDVSEFEETKLTPFFNEDFLAPYVEEAVIKIGLQFREEIPIKANGTILVLGEIKEVILPSNIIKKDGFLDLNTADTVAISGLDGYHSPKEIARMEYARPNKKPSKISY